jgi:hypothetical protein
VPEVRSRTVPAMLANPPNIRQSAAVAGPLSAISSCTVRVAP